MSHSLEIFGASIVLIGDFNPAIFTPDWLESQQLLGAADAQSARDDKTLVISHQVTRFETEWFILQVLEQQFSITSKGNVSDGLKDVVAGVFTLLSHTPIKAIGINTTAHFKIHTEETYQKIGNVLAPKDIWSSIFSKNVHLGMETLSIRIQPVNEEGGFVGNGDTKLITIQPSANITNGVYFLLNDHHNIESIQNKEETKAQSAVKILCDNWASEKANNIHIFEDILNQALNS